MSYNNSVITSSDKPFDNFNEESRQITMTHDPTKFVNHISYNSGLLIPSRKRVFKLQLNFKTKPELRWEKGRKIFTQFMIAIALFKKLVCNN
jgi:hypothetical protein